MIDLKEIRKLSVEERILIVESIWDSIAEDATSDDLKIPDHEKVEILSRYEAYRKGEEKTYSWDEVKAYVKEP